MTQKRKPRDERDLLNLPKPEASPPLIETRERFRAEGISKALEAVGKRLEGQDGKVYLGSVALHFYRIPLKPGDFAIIPQNTNLSLVPETLVAAALPEMGRALMQLYGRKPAAKTTDKLTRESTVLEE